MHKGDRSRTETFPEHLIHQCTQKRLGCRRSASGTLCLFEELDKHTHPHNYVFSHSLRTVYFLSEYTSICMASFFLRSSAKYCKETYVVFMNCRKFVGRQCDRICHAKILLKVDIAFYAYQTREGKLYPPGCSLQGGASYP